MQLRLRGRILFMFFFMMLVRSTNAQRVMENLDRGVVATRNAEGKVFISWRLFATEPASTTFNLYCTTSNNKTKRLNKQPLSKGTNYTHNVPDEAGQRAYFVKAIMNGKEGKASRSFILKPGINAWLSIPLQTPVGYSPNDASAGDLDGDGQYEIILHQTGRAKDNGSAGFTDPPIFQAYKLDGTMLWSINLGKNIREGAHYTQFMVYDLDGDGKAELAMKTADGTIDGKGQVIGDYSKDYRNKDGKILEGPEYFTIFSGETGEALATTDYLPTRYPTDGWGGPGGNGGTDNNGNRVDRFLACVAYLDGKLPSVVMCRGYYGRTVLAAWDWRNGKLTSRFVFDSKDGKHPTRLKSWLKQGFHLFVHLSCCIIL